MKQRHTLFPCGKLTLEGVYYLPQNPGNFPGVILCHPHPLYGGDMNNNVITDLASHLADNDIAAFTFNFRGIGQSQGSFDNGIGEINDARAALDWLIVQQEINADKIGIAGYSFGASAALPAACTDDRIKGVALISPSLHEQHIPQIQQCSIPKLIVSGSDDEIIVPEAVQRLQQEAAKPKEYFLIDGADHFWRGPQESIMIEKTASFFKAVFAGLYRI